MGVQSGCLCPCPYPCSCTGADASSDGHIDSQFSAVQKKLDAIDTAIKEQPKLEFPKELEWPLCVLFAAWALLRLGQAWIAMREAQTRAPFEALAKMFASTSPRPDVENWVATFKQDANAMALLQAALDARKAPELLDALNTWIKSVMGKS
jgi:hypothetical protein